MPVQDDGSGIQNILKLLDSGVAVIPDPDPGRNDGPSRFRTFYETIKFGILNFGIEIYLIFVILDL